MKARYSIPPKLAEQFLRWFCKDELLEEILGDLQEYYAELKEKSKWKKTLLYWFHMFNFLRPFAIKSITSAKTNHCAMFRHNFIISFRNFKRYKTSFFINLIGLSSGLACTLLIYLWVTDELAVDKFHEKDSRLYQIMERGETSEGIWVGDNTAGLLSEILEEEIPEVEYAVSTRLKGDTKTLSSKEKHVRASSLFASKNYFNVFSYDLLYGDKDKVLADKNAIVISDELAMNLFNTTENVVGKVLDFEQQRQFQISGIFRKIPSTSSVKFDAVISFELFKELDPNVLNWNYNTTCVYVVLKEDANVLQFNDKIVNILKSKRDNSQNTLFTRNYSDAYLYGKYLNGQQAGGRIEYVKLFSLIAIFILVIASINFMNLATAKASRRVKEVGIKKAVGASRKALIFQYLGESLMMAVVSLGIAILLVLFLLPQFNLITGKQLSLSLDINLLLSAFIITTITGIVAGSYPALYLSGFNPIRVLKGKLVTSSGEYWVRKGLVVFQFAFSLLLIASVIVVFKQVEYVQSKSLGYEKDNIIYFEKEGKVEEHLETFLSELRNIPGIINASAIGQSIIGGVNTMGGLSWEGKNPDEKMIFETRPITNGMLATLGISMKEGRTFSQDLNTEATKIIFNETAIKAMGLQNPIGKVVTIQGTNLEIIGVCKDFHFASLHEEIRPLFFVLRPSWTHKIMVKIQAGQEKKAIDQLRNFYASYNPGFPFDFHFLDEDYKGQYVAEQRVSTLSKYFTGLAILISCLGLFGLVAFTAERRAKEIGIRKILGASNFGIIRLLSGDYTKLVAVAILIALPSSFFLTRQWLEGFAYRIDLEWWFFAGAGGLVILIAWITISLQTIKAARINPVDCLKDE